MANSPEHYDALESRSPEERETALFGALPAQIAYAKENASYFRRLLKGVEGDAISSREGLGRAAGDAQGRSRRDAKRGAAAWRLRRHGAGANSQHLPIARSHPRTRRPRRRLLAHGARLLRRRLPRGRRGSQHVFLPLHPGRGDDRERLPRPWLHGVSRRHRPDRAAGRGHRGDPPDRLRRHAVVPQDPARKGAGKRAPTSPAWSRPKSAARPCRPACAPS